MNKITKTFKTKDLLEMNLPDSDAEGCTVVSDTICDQSRWATTHKLIVHFDDQKEGDAWRMYYDVGSTEQQEEGPWEYEDEVLAVLVREKEVTVKKWLPVEDETL
jgi:hypothetical protein